MFNESKVSSFVQNQFPQFAQEQYPVLVQFIQNYYKFLESNGNPLDLIHGLLDITDIDTYAEVDLTANTKEPIAIDDTEISVIGHVKFPRTDGLLKIDDEVILYKEREYISDQFNTYQLTIFKGCVRGYTYNSLTYEDGFVPSIKTTASAHTALATVTNQSFTYLLYFLDKLRSQFLVNYPQNSLVENRDKLNITNILKRAKDFYLTKGTPKGIEFYFKSLFQDTPEILNYNQNLMSPSNATYQSKFVIRTETLDNYYIPDLVGNTLVQKGKEFNVQTVENNFAGASQVYELEVSNGQNILPTQFCIITQYITNNRLYVDSTYGFENSGFIRIGNDLVEYTKKEYNYFEILNAPSFYEIGQRIYDVNTLAFVKDRPDSYFLIFAGITGFDILKNYSYYQEDDIGFVKDIAIDTTNIKLSSWVTNENIPFKLNENYVSGVSSIFTDQESLYLYSSGVPYYTFTKPSNVDILDAKHFKRIPLTFEKSLEGFKESTTPDFPVGFLLDGTPILNWKSNVVLTRGSLKSESVNIVDGGSGFNVDSPPLITFTSPAYSTGTTAQGNLVINGSVKDVYVENSGNNYPFTTVITVDKDPTDTEFQGDDFRPAVLEPVIVKGKIARVKIIDPGKGYSKQPTLRISPDVGQNSRATLSLLVDGSISRVNITNPGSRYDSDPSALISYGDGGSAVLTIQNGRITNIQSVNNGQNYKSPPIVEVIDSTGSGKGAKIICKIDSLTGSITEYKILNSGINYSQFGTTVEIYESGSGQFIEPRVDRWTLVNNYNVENDQYYSTSDGSFLFGSESLQDLEVANPKVEEISQTIYTEVVVDELGRDYINYYKNGVSSGESPVNILFPSYDLLAVNNYDLIDEGNIGIPVPFDIKFGSTSGSPTLVKKDEFIYINSNGFITFKPGVASTGWASEQLTPTSIGPSIQIGKDDLIIDKIFSVFAETSNTLTYAILDINRNNFQVSGDFELISGAQVINSWPSNTVGLYFESNLSVPRSLTTKSYDTSNGGIFTFDFIYSLPPTTVGERADTNEEVVVEYSLNNGISWITYRVLNFAQYFTGQWQAIDINLVGPLKAQNIKFRIRQPRYSGSGFDTWGLRNVNLVINTGVTSNGKFLIRYEGFHFIRGLNKTNPIKYELIFDEAANGIYDNNITINIIENDYTNTDKRTLVFTYGNDDFYEFDAVPVEAGKSYQYSTEIIPASSIKYPKTFTIIGAPKKLELSSGLVNFTDTTKHSPLIGWALDGSPIYGPYGYSNALDAGSSIKKMVSGWKLISTNSPSFNSIRLDNTIVGGLNSYTLGSFKEDYEYSTVGATLDPQNGRYCVTPEFPNGVYAYFMTVDINDKQSGFPYFIGEYFSGKTYLEFNSLDSIDLRIINNLTRYLNPSTSLYEKTRPLDPGTFSVSSVPSSVNATIESLNVIEGGSGYKVGDKLVFDNTGTEGFSAAGFVSLLEGKPISSTTYNYYDYLEYEDDKLPFTTGSTIATADGFSATIHSTNQNNKHLYLSNVSGTIPSKQEIIYDTTLTPEVLVETELVGKDFTNSVTTALATTAVLNVAIDSTTTYLDIGSFTNCTINDFYSTTIPKYIKIDEEYIRVISIVDSNHIIVRRGFRSIQQPHAASSSITLLSDLLVFDSSQYNPGDIIKVDNEIFKVVDISVRKNPEKLFTKIVDGSGTSGANIYYLFINEVLQENSLAPIPTQGTIVLNANGDVVDLVFDDPSLANPNLPPISANPKIEILDNNVYTQSSIVDNINILGSSYEHTLILERASFNTIRELHYPRSKVNRLIYIDAKVKYYEEDRILARFNSNSNGLIQGDNITVTAARKITKSYNLNINTAGTLSITATGETYTANSTTTPLIVLYEQSSYSFNVLAGSNPIKLEFYSLSDTKNKEKQYFDLDTSITQNASGRITRFTIIPKDSDLTNLIMRITSLSTGISRDVRLNIRFEPYTGEHVIETGASSYFEFYINRNPLFTDYTSNTISYITNSKTADGSIHKCTLTSGGFNYKTLPAISNIISQNGKGFSIEAQSTIIGSVKSIDNTSNGYGYNPNSSYAPIISFPVICKLKNNFKVISCTVDDPGSGYLFQPNIVITGGGLGNGDPGHAVIVPIISNEKIIAVNVAFSGFSYSSSPNIIVEKEYFTSINSNGDLTFKFNFNKYFQENDSYKVRAYYYDTNNNLLYRESSITFYADLQTSGIKSRTVINGTTYVNPKDYINESGITVEYYKLSLLERTASVNAIVDKSDFIAGEKIIINNDPNIYGYISTVKGWQKSNSIIRIIGLQYTIKENDFVRGVDSESYGKVEFTDGVNTKLKLGAYLQKPKQFLTTYSFLSDNILKLQDNFRYQKFAYEISTNIPFNSWKENYISTAHPAGYNLFAKTKINQKVKLSSSLSTKVKVSTDVSSVVRINQKYNYLITKNLGLDEVKVANRLLTDVKNIQTSVVAAFEDISDQFDGIKSSFELKIIDPITPKLPDNVTDNFITDYDIDQMVVILDNIIQTYGDSWTVTDSDKTFNFESVQQAGEFMPDGELLFYRQLNESNEIYGFNTLTTSAGTTFSLVEQDSTPFPSSVLGLNYDAEDWLVFVDGVLQLSEITDPSYSITTSQLVFTESIPSGTQISARCIVNSHRNEFVNGSVTSGTPIVLSSKPVTTSKESYFVFVNGVLMSTSDFELDGSNNLVFNYSFSYDSLIVFIDHLGVSLDTSYHNIVQQLYNYKIEDGQSDIPVGITIDTNQYILDINGVVQTPFVSYTAGASGVRKINFSEPPQKYVKGDIEVGRQFVALLYQRQDVTGSLGSTPNYQFDDISKNRIFVKNVISDLVVGDYIIDPTNDSSAVIDKIIDRRLRRVVLSTISQSNLTTNSTFTVPLNEVTSLVVGDRVIFDAAIGLTDPINQQLEISSINKQNKTVTLKNISASTLNITISQNNSLRFSHRELIVINIETSQLDRDDAFAPSNTLLSGYISAVETPIQTSLNETYMVLQNDTTIEVNDATLIQNGDYLIINDVEVVKVTNKSSNTLTVSRSQLATSAPIVHANNANVTKIEPIEVECSAFIRGFDGDKLVFPLLELESPVYIEANKDIFVIVNGILQKRGQSYTIIENDPDGTPNSGDEYSELQFTEAPSDSTPFNCFYVGETIAIQNISPQFNSVKTSFDLRSVTGEVFSLISNNRPDANISANLILFIDGVYQIPSTTEPGRLEAYDDIISSFKLLGSVIDFTSPPKRGSDFEGYIYVGSINDYKSVNVDATVESDDILIQYNELQPRRILQKTSATKLSVSESLGLRSPDSTGIDLGGENSNNWWKTDLIKVARVRESLRARRCLVSAIYDIPSPSPYPLTGKTLYTATIQGIEIENISSDLPISPDDDTNKINFILPSTTNFPERVISFSYVSFVPRNPLIVGSKDLIQNLRIVDLPFNQILKVDVSGTFPPGNQNYSDLTGYYFAGNVNTSEYTVTSFDYTNGLVYVKLTTPGLPITIPTVTDIYGYPLLDDDLINEYQTLSVGDKLLYNF